MQGLLTVAEVAERLSLTSRRITALIEDGRLPAEKFGRAWVIRETDLALIAHRPNGRPRSATPGE